MVFAYYSRLTRSQKRIYRQSDEITTIPLPKATPLHPLVDELAEALKNEGRRKIEALSQGLISDLTTMLKVPPVRVEVLAARPSKDWGELHGLYTPAEGRRPARVTVWMRTAKHRRVVAFRTFLRTLLHELCHHLDYELLDLEESFHTEGFYKRESSLFHQLVPNRPQEDSSTTES
ncbi:MAG TPA: hypothetical protein VFL31_06630 [Nitrospiraceae bacterium]|nr:hypothetical protein [Nitrospiraceae bacterium]